jgi:hypothetical protein
LELYAQKRDWDSFSEFPEGCKRKKNMYNKRANPLNTRPRVLVKIFANKSRGSPILAVAGQLHDMTVHPGLGIAGVID